MKADSAPTQRDKLLAEGGLSYPKAMLALSQFREMVQRACIEAMKQSLSGLSAALRLQLKSQQVKAWDWPDLDDPHPSQRAPCEADDQTKRRSER